VADEAKGGLRSSVESRKRGVLPSPSMICSPIYSFGRRSTGMIACAT
jgi:hypothetical protein